MEYLKDAFELAKSRNYLDFPEVQILQEKAPKWFHSLGTENGLSDFKAKYGKQVPAALQEFYRCLPLACFIEATTDGNVFLKEFEDEELPLVVTWTSTEYLAFVCHGHSESVGAVSLEGDDPLVFWGFEDEEEYIKDSMPDISFTEWIFNQVNGYDKRLDYWLNFYKELKSNPAEVQRRGSNEWILKMPGMAEKLKKENL